MKKVTTTILAFLLTISVFGNDGTYLTHGSVIYPIQESRISLEREILSFSVKDKICQVDILFEFNNPDNVDRKLLIGFQAPDDHIDGTPNISNFTIISNGQILPYKIKAAECEDCELKDLKEFQFSEYENGTSGVFVYLFEITFKPGINKINHSYSFPASGNVAFDQMYYYVLKTGAKWAGGTIKNLTIQFDLGQNKYFYVYDIFGKNANWSIIGSGKVTNKYFNYYDEISCRMVRILSGKLQIDVKDFKPTKNIDFGIINENSFSMLNFSPIDSQALDNENIEGSISSLKLFDDTNYSKEELKILRNWIYAQYGYAFQSKDLRDYFSQFEWYMPDPNLIMKQIKLTKEESKFIDEILKREKNLQK